MRAAGNEDLWSLVDAAMFEATSRAETIAEVNRLLHKCNPEAGCGYFTEENSTLVRRALSVPQLAKFWRGHTRTEARRYDPPIIVAEYRRTAYVLDGTRRINEWLAFGDTEAHDTILIKRGQA